jgi:hypothetical protein
MQTPVSNLRLKEETSTKLKLETPNRKWLFLIGVLLFLVIPVLLLIVAIQNGSDQIVGIVSFAIVFLMSFSFLLFNAFRSEVIVHSDARRIVLERSYWLGIGALGRKREKSWSLDDVTNLDISSRGITKIIDIEVNGKKDFILGFSSRKKEDAQRFHDVLQSWRNGLPLDAPETINILNKQAEEKSVQDTLKSAQKMLFYFGGFSLLSGVMGFFTDSMLSSISTYTMISIFTGLLYLACGYGAKQRSEIALWIAMFVVVAERLYWFVQARLLNGAWNFSSVLTWVFAFFVVSVLWKAIQSIRTMEENPNSQILA